MTSSALSLHPFSLLLALLLSLHGLRKGSLSSSGALAAFLVGYLTLANPLPTFGHLLIVFYLSGSRATKVKAAVKRTLEREAPLPSGASAADPTQDGNTKAEASKRSPAKNHDSGNRTAQQVLCNSLGGTLASISFRLLYSGELPPSSSLVPPRLQRPGSVGPTCLASPPAARFLLLVAVGHYACCLGDTFASELGILSRRPPRLVTQPWRTVPPGTNGGTSAWGTVCSALGGATIGLTTLASLYLSGGRCWLEGDWARSLKVCTLATAAGLGGSMLDSVLGATMQQTLYSSRLKQVLLGRLPAPRGSPSKRNDHTATSDWDPSHWQVVTGHDILTNNQVNLFSSTVTALLTAWLGTRWLS